MEVYNRWVLTTNEEILYIKIESHFFSFVDGDASVEQESNWKERARTQTSRRESALPVGTDFNQNSRPCIILKQPHDLHAILAFYWS